MIAFRREDGRLVEVVCGAPSQVASRMFIFRGVGCPSRKSRGILTKIFRVTTKR
jgi:hypothetical protein